MNKYLLIVLSVSMLMWSRALYGVNFLESTFIPLPEVEVVKVAPSKVSFKSITLEVVLAVNNPTPLGIHCRLRQTSLLKEDKVVGTFGPSPTYFIPRNRKKSVVLTCQLSMQKVLDSALSFLMNRQLNLHIRGDIQLAALYLISFTIPFYKDISIDLSGRP